MITAALAMLLDQVPFIGLEEDRKAFEPYRQCVLASARSQYPTGDSLKVIIDKASRACAGEEVRASAAILANAMERAQKTAPDGPYRVADDGRMGIFHNELLFEVADDFVPKSK